jgi:hypothetical protein
VFKEDIWPRSVMTCLEDERTTLHVEGIPRARKRRQWPPRNMSANEESFKVKDKDDGENLGKDGYGMQLNPP